MEKSKNSINVEGGFLFCGGWNFSKSVSVGSTFIREMRVCKRIETYSNVFSLCQKGKNIGFPRINVIPAPLYLEMDQVRR